MSSSLSLIISSFDLKWEACNSSFTWTPNFNCCVSGNRKTWGGGGRPAQWSSQNTHTYGLSSRSYRGTVCGAPNNYNSNIRDHWSQTTIANRAMKKSEILWELPKHYPATRSEQMLLGKRRWQTFLTQGCHKPSIYKNKTKKPRISGKCKMRYACSRGSTVFSYFREVSPLPNKTTQVCNLRN